MGKFKTPTLRGLRQSAPYMHDGRFATLAAVVEHYRVPPPQPTSGANVHELLPLELTPDEAAALVAFLGSLDGAVGGDARWVGPPVPTGNSASANRRTGLPDS
jgi:cytochrome c peroxidase